MSRSALRVPRALSWRLTPLLTGFAMITACGPSGETAAADVRSQQVACADLTMFTAPDVEIVTAEEMRSPGANETHPTTGRVTPAATAPLQGNRCYRQHDQLRAAPSSR